MVFVVDREPAITNALESMLPNATVLHCWNHIKRDVRYWLISHKTPTERIPSYTNDIDRLLKCSDEEELLSVEQEITDEGKWSAAFTTYYQSKIRPDICKYSGKWILEGTGFYDPYSGITNNASESFNKVLKWMNDYKKMPMDMMILSLFNAQNAAYTEVLRGRAGLGQYKLKGEFQYTSIDVKDLYFPHKYTHPEDIIRQAKMESDRITRERQVGLESEKVVVETEADAADVATEGVTEEPTEGKNVTLSHFTNVTDVADKAESEKKGKEKNLSQRSLAQAVIDANGTEEVQSMDAYMVKGVRSKVYAVTLDPEKCQCPSTGMCYHIMAVKLKLGLPLDQKVNEKKSIRLMKYNSRPRVQRRIGQKKPKQTDFENPPEMNDTLVSNLGNDSIKKCSQVKETSTPLLGVSQNYLDKDIGHSSIKKEMPVITRVKIL